MGLKQLFQYFILHCIVFTILVFIAFYIYESGHMDTVLWGAFLYMPYVLMLSGLNIILIKLGLIKMTKRPLAFLTVFFMSIVLIIWLSGNGGQLTIRYWELTLPEFVILNTIIIGLNLLTVDRLTRKNAADDI
jgi:hypothetical protein